MRVAFLLPADTLMLEAVGPFDVFATANRLLGTGAYDLQIVARSHTVVGAGGLRVVADRTIGEPDEPIDTLLVAGPLDIDRTLAAADLIAWVARRAPAIPRYASVCTGAFILAAAHLLDGRRATTHWQFASALAARYPKIEVEPDRLFVRDGPVWTSAGVSAGIDLALALVEQDHGQALALDVARQLVVFLKRPGGQSQFSAHLAAQFAGKSVIQEVQAWVLDNIAAELSIRTLAARAGMSVRNFARVFQAEARVTPARFVEAARVDAARRMLEESRLPVKSVAARCGFGTVGRMRRAFQRQLGLSPQDYRQRFQSAAAG